MGILSSNRQENITKWLLANNLNVFHDIICIPFQGNKTPYLQTIRKVFSSQQDFFFVSDESKDLIQAREAGFSPIGVTWGFDNFASLEQAKSDAILSSPKELITTCSLLAQNNFKRSKL